MNPNVSGQLATALRGDGGFHAAHSIETLGGVKRFGKSAVLETVMSSLDPQVLALRRLCERVGGYDAVAREIGANGQSIYQIITGRKLPSGNPKGVGPKLRAKLTEHFPDWLAAGHGQTRSSDSELGDGLALKRIARLPLVGEVKGGSDGYLEEMQYPVGHGEGTVEYPTADPNAYALRVRGDSMHPRYRAGEFVIVEPGIEPQEGDDVVVLCTNGSKMLKQLNWRRGDEVQLLSINNGYAPVTLQRSEIESIQLATGRARRSALIK